MPISTETMEVRFIKEFRNPNDKPVRSIKELGEIMEDRDRRLLRFIQSELSLSQNRILEEVEYIIEGAEGVAILASDSYTKNNIKNLIIKPLEDIIKLISKKDNQSTLTKGN